MNDYDIERQRWRREQYWWFALLVFSVGGGLAGLWSLSMMSHDDTRVVVKSCLNGSVIFKNTDGQFRLMRQGATVSWPVTGPEVCQ